MNGIQHLNTNHDLVHSPDDGGYYIARWLDDEEFSGIYATKIDALDAFHDAYETITWTPT